MLWPTFCACTSTERGPQALFGRQNAPDPRHSEIEHPQMCSYLLIFCKCYETPHFLQHPVKISDENLRYRTAIHMTFEKHSFLAWVPRVHFLELIASEAPERYPKSPTSSMCVEQRFVIDVQLDSTKVMCLQRRFELFIGNEVL